ncbi:hypothetical protein GCM10018963_39540 [Saccharothrix longispora]
MPAQAERAVDEHGVVPVGQRGGQQVEDAIEQHRHVTRLLHHDPSLDDPPSAHVKFGCRQVPARPSNLAPGKVRQGR